MAKKKLPCCKENCLMVLVHLTSNRTYPNPFPSPESLSRTSRTASTVPQVSKCFRNACSCISAHKNNTFLTSEISDLAVFHEFCLPTTHQTADSQQKRTACDRAAGQNSSHQTPAFLSTRQVISVCKLTEEPSVALSTRML